MRIRSIKPEFWRSDDITILDIEDRLLFIGLWSYVDDNGVALDKLAAITADLFAGDLERDSSETFARVSRGLQNLSEAGRITRYTVAGKDFLHVTNWEKHQRIDKPNKPRFPLPTSTNAEIRDTLAIPSRDKREGPASGTEEQRNRGTGEQGIKNSSSPAATEQEFEQAWAHWPKKRERKKSFEKFQVAARSRGVNKLVADVERFGDAYAATTATQFVPALAAWLSGERWTDDLPQPQHKLSKPSSIEHGRAVDAIIRARETALDRTADVVHLYREVESNDNQKEIEG